MLTTCPRIERNYLKYINIKQSVKTMLKIVKLVILGVYILLYTNISPLFDLINHRYR